jgi:hypothetical protein
MTVFREVCVGYMCLPALASEPFLREPLLSSVVREFPVIQQQVTSSGRGVQYAWRLVVDLVYYTPLTHSVAAFTCERNLMNNYSKKSKFVSVAN